MFPRKLPLFLLLGLSVAMARHARAQTTPPPNGFKPNVPPGRIAPGVPASPNGWQRPYTGTMGSRTDATPAPWNGPLPNFIALRDALRTGTPEQAGREIGKTLVLMAEAQAGRQDPFSPVRAALARSPLDPDAAMQVTACVTQNWHIAQQLHLLTPENIRRLQAGDLPLADGRPVQIQQRKNDYAPGQTQALLSLAPESTVTPAEAPVRGQTVLRVSFQEIKSSQPLSLQPFGGGAVQLHIYSTDSSSGIVYVLSDPSKTTVQRDLNPLTRTYSDRAIPSVHNATAPKIEVPIPGTSERGILITKVAGVDYYLATMGAPLNSYRIAACVHPTAIPATPRPRSFANSTSGLFQ